MLETARKLAEQHDFSGPSLREAIPYLEAFQGKKFVLKIGGSVLEDEQLVPQLVSDVVFLKRLDINVVIVHGGARQLDRRMRALGMETSKVNGLRATTKEGLEVANEVFLEISNKIKKRRGRQRMPRRYLRPLHRPGLLPSKKKLLWASSARRLM